HGVGTELKCYEHYYKSGGEEEKIIKIYQFPCFSQMIFEPVLAREDIDEAVHAILFRENYVVKRLDTYFQHLDTFKERRKEMLHRKWIMNVAEPIQQRIMGKVTSNRGAGKTKRENFECFLKSTDKTVPSMFYFPTGKQYFAKELKETKDRLHAKWPPFIFTRQNVVPKESHKASGVPRKSKAFRYGESTQMNKPICMEKKRLFGKEKTTDLSQLAFERQFRVSQLHKNKEAEKRGLVLGTRQQRPRSWAAGDHEQRWGPQPVERRVMTAEVLGKHLASLQGMARQGHHWHKVIKLHGLRSAMSCNSYSIGKMVFPSRSGRILQEMSR
uniref:Family with sequence similarity 228 member A n=1 Tax=Spermophilus dauricus TaxID=99837 RepID=A0A8C9QM16_SPEDA